MAPTLKELKEMRKKSVGDGFFVDVILRSISLFITKILLYFPVTPNMVTSVGILITILATVLFASGTYSYMLIASILVLLAYVCDCIDGEIARCKKISSIKGSFYDDLSYALIETLPIIGITIGLYKNFNNEYIFYAGLIYLFSISFMRIVSYLKFNILFKDVLRAGKESQVIKKQSKSSAPPSKKFLSIIFKPIKSTVKFVFHLSGYTTLLILFTSINKLHLLFLFYAASYPLLLVLMIFYQFAGRFDDFLSESVLELRNK
jgi:phosphatidylglycerophosphate synthase